MAITSNVLDGGIAFNEWHSISFTTDYNGDGQANGGVEAYVELVNTSASSIDISGYQYFHINNGLLSQLAHTVPGGTTLAAGETYTIVSNNGSLTATMPSNITGQGAVADIAMNQSADVNLFLANPEGDFIVLQENGGNAFLGDDIIAAGLNPANQVGIDVVTAAGADQSIARVTDGEDTFETQTPSPGEPNCFFAGSRIATPSGMKAIEELAVGDQIMTASGRIVPIVWLARQTLSTKFGRPDALPVRIMAGALGEGLPIADLTLTADHAVVIDGVLVNAGVLVNGTTIVTVPLTELENSYTVYHIEIDEHDVILAEGLPTESFVDYTGRDAFDNHAEYLAMYGGDRLIREMALPRITARRLMPPSLRALLGMNHVTADSPETSRLNTRCAA
ncbi:Hint domain-containing protein [Roseovarius mucosus]|uniref:Hint domain-containing protein n=1 Tax=Roseovarius mucosus TaxID=215743 RepID=UPI001C602B8E|nr:Hint domain-containing protein [Roseovarius mucosus]MBW4975592.1 Hint domain-containing protein [Roseovarius mucosus]